MGVGWAPIRAVGTVRDECRGVPGARGDPVMTGGRALERGTSWTPRVIQPMRPTRAAPIASLPTSALILDGEVAVFDEHLRSRLDFLRRPAPHALVTPPMYIIFDCVYASGRDLRPYALGVRREVLEALIDGQHLLLPARRLPAHGLEAWAEVQRRGYEGLVAKDESSAYRGGLTRSWLKVRSEERRVG